MVRPPTKERKQIETQICHTAVDELEDLLVDAGPEAAILASRGFIEKEIQKIVEKASLPEEMEGKRFFLAKERASEGILSQIRYAGAQSLLVGDLDQWDRVEITNGWNRNWEVANQSWKQIENLTLWRCGGAVFAIGDPSKDGTPIRSY